MGKIMDMILMERRIKNLESMIRRNPGQHWEAHAKGLIGMLNKKVAAIRITFQFSGIAGVCTMPVMMDNQ